MLVNNKRWNLLLWGWFGFNIFLALGALLDGEPSLLMMLLIWVGGIGGLCYAQRARLASILSSLAPRWRFFVLGMSMAILEEVIVTLLGGGLGGHTDSLAVDLANTIPLFFFWLIAWWFLINRYTFTMRQVLWLAALNGWVFETIYSGILVINPLSAILFFPMFAAVYAIIIYLPLLTVREILQQGSDQPHRYGLGLSLPFLIIPPIIVVLVIGEILFPALYPFN